MAIKKFKKSRKVGLTKGRAVVIAIMSLVMLVIVTWMLYPIRNGKSENVARRFLKHNEKIRFEVGEIVEFSGFGVIDITAKSREIAERLRTGQHPYIVDTSNQNQEVKRVPSDETWESGKVIGTNKTLEVKIRFRKHLWFDSNDIYYHTVIGASYKDENENWNEIPIGWLDNYFLLFR